LKEEQKRLNFRVTRSMYDSLVTLSAKDCVTISELLRELIAKQLSVEAVNADMDNIRSHIRAELKALLEPEINRIIKCVIKGGISASASCFLSAEALRAFVPEHRQVEYEKAIRESKKIGIVYMRGKDNKVEELLKESQENLRNRI
jgi:hypothetical protein